MTKADKLLAIGSLYFPEKLGDKRKIKMKSMLVKCCNEGSAVLVRHRVTGRFYPVGQGGLPQELTLKLRSKQQAEMEGGRSLGGGSSKYKYPEAGRGFLCSRDRRKPSVRGALWGDGEREVGGGGLGVASGSAGQEGL